MAKSVKSILDQALELRATERADVEGKQLFSQESPDSKIYAIWAKEADARIEAYEKGEVEIVSAEYVLAKYRRS